MYLQLNGMKSNNNATVPLQPEAWQNSKLFVET